MMDRSLEGRAIVPAGYRMIDTFLVENFRCFKHLELDNLARINVIVGQNASGKTALLEALFFAAHGNPEILIRLRAMRGHSEGQLAMTTDRHGYEALFREFFYEFDFTKAIATKTVGSNGNSREMTVSYSPQGNIALVPSSDSYSQVPLVFAGVDAGGKPFSYRADMTARGISYDATLQGVPAIYFSSGLRPPLRETADRFSMLDIRGELGRLIATLNERFKFIKNLSLVSFGGYSLIYAETTTLKEKIPIGVVSNGIERFLNVLLGIASNANGIVLVDELDSCVHHSKIAGVWEALRDFSETYSVQLFVSTHSAEWLSGLNLVLGNHEKDFALLRAETANDGSHVIRKFSGDVLASAVKEEMEIR